MIWCRDWFVVLPHVLEGRTGPMGGLPAQRGPPPALPGLSHRGGVGEPVVLQVAKAVFAEHGAHASLNKIAQRAGVGAGTLYRHFPTLQALLVAIVGDDVEALCAEGRALLTHPSADEALHTWLYAVALHATALRGLVATEMATEPTPATNATLAACHEAIRATAAALPTRATTRRRRRHRSITVTTASRWAGAASRWSGSSGIGSDVGSFRSACARRTLAGR
ncbi:MAG TPA: TetR/AcrR family transcriptional regulator [Planosporangium sp.]|nr:TetR/AcrR family transcriptional regulator [Planosporangium sp.]